MGTRADFYVGTGEDAEWLGSVAWDGYVWEERPDCPLMNAKTEADFREAVNGIAKEREDWTPAEAGWPWPWDDSHTTDRVYAFVGGRTQCFPWGKGAEWPNMKDRKKLAPPGSNRSGIMVFYGP